MNGARGHFAFALTNRFIARYGAGQLSHLLFNLGYRNYVGLDFSENAITRAIYVSNKYNTNHIFAVKDLYKMDRIEGVCQYDLIIMCEVLEHLDRDLFVLEKIREKTPIIFTVPTFDAENHVRHFTSFSSIENRYKRNVDIELMERVGNVYLVKGKVFKTQSE